MRKYVILPGMTTAKKKMGRPLSKSLLTSKNEKPKRTTIVFYELAFWKRCKVAAAEDGLSLSDFIVNALQKCFHKRAA